MGEEKKKLSFSIACNRRPTNPPYRPSAAAADGPSPNPAPTVRQFVTEFDPSQTLPPAAASVVMAPLPNSFNFDHRKPSSLPTSGEEAALAAISAAAGSRAFVLDADPSDTSYGLTLRDAVDMAALPETLSREFSVALLAGYGWSEGQCVGKNHRNRKEDANAFQCRDRLRIRDGKPAFGSNPSDHDARKSRSGDWIFGATKVTGNGTAKKGGRDARDPTEEKGCCNASRHKIRSGEKRSMTEASHKVQWLHSHIRVRVVVTEKLGKRLYLMKGKVVDVVSPAACDVVMDDVGQDVLETVLPRTNGRVLVLCGKHKGVCGRLVEKNSEEIGLVEDADTKIAVRVRYDQMAEYTGDLELLGY